LRSVFVVFQFTISILLFICTLVVKEQMSFIKNYDVGYARDQIVALDIKELAVRNKLETIKTELKRNPNILKLSSSTYLPNRILDQTSFNWPGKEKNIYVPTYVSFVDYEYVNLYELDVIEGRNFSKKYSTDANGAFLLNEAAVKALDWKSPIGCELIHWSGNKGNVVGIVKDFNFHSLHRDIEPLYLYLEPKERNYYLSIKIKGNHIPETLNYIKDYMEPFSAKYPFSYRFFDEIFDQAYQSELRMEQVFTIFATIAIFIACLGLLGLASFTVERRTKEIGVRKVLGSSIPNILFLLSKEFIKWILVANLIAWPVAWIIMKKWLLDFAYRTNLGLDVFLFASLIAFIIAMVIVSYQTGKAAHTNPVNSLRYE